ncbi:MAG: hypothetical protein H0U73_08265 [Tatlockia sp.]|nr:hypothetical protein [Tatlockia sp.]
MQINLEAADHNSIQAYGDHEIKINSEVYQSSLIVSRHEIIDWPITSIQHLNEESLELLLKYDPKVILIGHNQTGQLAPLSIIQTLTNRRIGIETMSIGAACRTFNLLLNEHREVVIGIII